MSALRLPADLRRELRARLSACLVLEVSGECAVVLKVPRGDAERLGRPGLLIRATLAYARMDTAPVLALAVQIDDSPERPFQADTYFEVAQPWDVSLVERLGRQETLKVFVLDEALRPAAAKQIRWGEVQRREARELLARALGDLQALPAARYDFARAKADFQARYSLRDLLGLPG